MRVLMADGDEMFIELAQRFLLNHGYEVNIATNGLETVAGMRSELPDVVVLDREMLWGGSDGVLALMRQIRRWSEIPVILISDDDVPEESGSVASRPVVAQLQKPYRLEDLLVRLHACNRNGTPDSLSVVAQGGRP